MSDNTIAITHYNGSGGVGSIPSTIEGKTVTSIGDLAFYRCDSLTSVTIPNSVTSIEDGVFDDCTSRTGVYFKGNAPGIGSDMFTGDDNATVYYLPGHGLGSDVWRSPDRPMERNRTNTHNQGQRRRG